MAFENINWFAPAQSETNQAAQFQQLLGNAILSYQKGQEMDLKRRQLEMEGVDVSKVAENELMRTFMGMPPTQRGQGAIAAMQQLSVPQIFTDIAGRQVQIPGKWGNLSGITGRPTPSPNVLQSLPQNIDYSSVQPVDLNAQYGGNVDMSMRRPLTAKMAGGEAGIDMDRINQAGVDNVNRLNTTADNINPVYPPDNPNVEQKANEQFWIEKNKAMIDKERQQQKATRPLFKPAEGYEPSDKDITTMTDLTVSKNVLDQLLDEYITKVKTYGVSVEGTKGQKKIDTTLGQIRMQIKNLEQLGALQAPDIQAMNEMLGSATIGWQDIINPVSGYTQLTEGKKIAVNAANEFKQYIDKVYSAQAQTRGFELIGQNKNVSNKNTEQPQKKRRAFNPQTGRLE